MSQPRKTVLITGSSTGIGRAAAELFLDRGWNVAASMRSPERGADLAARGALCPAIDVTGAASVRAGVAATLSRFGRIDVLVNNAGYALMGPLEAWSEDELRRQLETNLVGLIGVTREVLPHMRSAGGGVVVNVSSIGGRIGFPLTAAYHATKFAVEGLSESMRFELKRHNVRVKIVEPGGIRTDFISRGIRWAEHDAYAPEIAAMKGVMEFTERNVPGPHHVARTIYRAATDGSRRLRYPSKPGPFLALNRFLPDAVWRWMIHTTMRRFGGRPAQEVHAPSTGR